MSGEKILIVDDEEHIRRLCAEILQRNGFHPVALGSPKAAIQIAQAEPFDLLLTDISMAELNGFKLLAEVKEIQKDIASVVMTGYGTIDNAVQSLRLGAQGFVIKPFSRHELIQAVDDALEKKRLFRENMRLKLLMPLFEVGKTLLSELHVTTLLDTVNRVALRETHSDAAAVMLAGDESGRFEPGSSLVSGGWTQEDLFHRGHQAVGDWVKAHKGPLVLSEGGGPEDDINRWMAETGMGSLLLMPFISKERVIGALVLCKKPGRASYAQGDLDLISILGGQAAIAIENAKMFETIQAKNLELETFCFETVSALAQAIEVKDVYTGGHGDRLSDFALAIAERLGLPDNEKLWLKYAAALHDIGKIGVKESILTKPGKLSESEYEEMKKHPAKGAEILREVRFLAPVVPIVYHHQEQFDGKGYPEGLAGNHIPIGSRIVAVLDAFDAMTTDRPYRKALPMERAIRELRRYSGVQFDPKVVEAFIEVVAHPPHTA